ncbi:putative retrotransposon hot spot protein 4 (RHS4) [Trypanosoma vivax]|nr:putative retrotransposon hot spot protein 4 (RHS4) [Trypanosoma vivax]
MCAFMYKSVVDEVVGKMNYLHRTEDDAMQPSVLTGVNPAERFAQDHRIVGFGFGTRRQVTRLGRDDLMPRVLYIPDIPNFPVLAVRVACAGGTGPSWVCM